MVVKPPSELSRNALAALREGIRRLREEQGLPALEPEPDDLPLGWLTTKEWLAKFPPLPPYQGPQAARVNIPEWIDDGQYECQDLNNPEVKAALDEFERRRDYPLEY